MHNRSKTSKTSSGAGSDAKEKEGKRPIYWQENVSLFTKLPIWRNSVVRENTIRQLNILETGVLTLVVQNSSPTRLCLFEDGFWTTGVRTPVSKIFRWRTYSEVNISHF